MFLASGFVLCRKIIFYHPIDVIHKWYERGNTKRLLHTVDTQLTEHTITN